MKYLILMMALISAFFVSTVQAIDLDLDNLRPAEKTTQFCGKNQITGVCGETLEENKLNSCQAAAPMMSLSGSTEYRWDSAECVVDGNSYKIKKNGVRIYSNGQELPTSDYYTLTFTNPSPEEGEKCPPANYPMHIHPVPVNGESYCAKELETPYEPDDSCDEFGIDNWLPNNDQVASGSNVCYTNPITGKQCQFSKNPIAGYSATGGGCSGEEPPYGEKPKADLPDPNQPDKCRSYGSNNQTLMCEVDPDDKCNVLQVSGSIQYQCPAGCGALEGKYFCAHDDKDGNKIPDDWPDGTPPDELPPTETPPDKPPTPTEEPPTTEGTNNILNGISSKINGTNTRLDGLGTKVDGLGTKLDGSNRRLDGINSGIQGLKEGQKASNGLLGSISNSNEQIRKNTGFTADNTGELLDSFNEFKDGFGETDIDNNFDPSKAKSFYESDYEDGFQGVWDTQSAALKQTGFFEFLQQFKMSFGGGSAPDMQICFNVMVDLGCKNIPFDWTAILPFLKLCILLTAAFTCRKIIFGG